MTKQSIKEDELIQLLEKDSVGVTPKNRIIYRERLSG